jgi:23S rRNA pseudouridine1911/1915/1917 synthase
VSGKTKSKKRDSADIPPLKERILLMNDDIIVVNKIAGEAMEGARRGMVDLPAALAETFPGSSKAPSFSPVAVHRLDVPVSGCALFARTPSSLSFLNEVFSRPPEQGRRAEKYYWAIVEKNKNPASEISEENPPLAEAGELVHWIQVNKKNNSSRAYGKSTKARKEAILRYRIRGEGDNYIFLEIELVTGRHHQIRAQLAAIGLHIKGDLKYGAARSESGGGIRLHARSLYFPDPSSPDDFISCSAQPPKMDALWEAFMKS